MKLFILSAFVFSCGLFLSQGQQKYTYDLKIARITNRDEARVVTNILRMYIMPETKPFDFFLSFHDDEDRFTFDCGKFINEEEFRVYLKEKHRLDLVYIRPQNGLALE